MSHVQKIAAVLLTTVLLLSACSLRVDPNAPLPPLQQLRCTEAKSIYGMIATGSEEATGAGVEVLEAGGNAVDAAVAAAFALGVSDPADSGFGGATVVVGHMADGRSFAIEGTSSVPIAADRRLVAEIEKRDYRYVDGPELAATPGSLKALARVAEEYGSRPLSLLLEPAMRIAEEGYLPTPTMVMGMGKYLPAMQRSFYLSKMVLRDGVDLPRLDERQCRPDLLQTMRRICEDGVDDFYSGAIAEEIYTDLYLRGGFISRADLALLRTRKHGPLRTNYRGFEILTMPSPGIGDAIIEALNILENFPREVLAEQSVDRMQIYADAFRIALEDHHRYRTNPNAPVLAGTPTYLGKAFARERAQLITLGNALSPELIDPATRFRRIDGDTTQVSVIDRWGNAVSLTQTLGRFFGSKVVTPGLGFPYNSQLEGLVNPKPRDLIPTDMAPTIVLENGEAVLVLGSAGSSRIPAIVSSVISAVIDGDADAGPAVLQPRVIWGGGQLWPQGLVEVLPPITPGDMEAFRKRGFDEAYSVQLPAQRRAFVPMGAVNLVTFDRETRELTGVVDPRRGGLAKGAEF